MKSLYQKSISFDEKEKITTQDTKNIQNNENNNEIKSVTEGNKILIKCEIKKENKKQFINILSDSNPINEKDCDIYINGKLIDFQKQYRFEEEGEYDIELLFKNNMENLKYFFYYCICYTKIDFTFFNSELVSDISGMFQNCTSLKEVKFGNFNTNNINNMASLFQDCSSLSKIDLSSFKTNEVQQMQNMFIRCPLTSIDLSNFDFSKATNISQMFYGCSSLKEIKMSDSFGEKGKTIAYFAYGVSSNGILYCSGKRVIKNIILTGLNNWKIVYSWE